MQATDCGFLQQLFGGRTSLIRLTSSFLMTLTSTSYPTETIWRLERPPARTRAVRRRTMKRSGGTSHRRVHQARYRGFFRVKMETFLLERSEAYFWLFRSSPTAHSRLAGRIATFLAQSGRFLSSLGMSQDFHELFRLLRSWRETAKFGPQIKRSP